MLRLFLVAALLFCSHQGYAQAGSVTGTVTDIESGWPLPGASVQVQGSTYGTAANEAGKFLITGLAPGTYTLLFRYAGYRYVEQIVTIAASETAVADAALTPGLELDPIQITAGRSMEKVLDAPASVSVVDGHEITLDAPQTAVRALRNVTSVDMAQTGVDRHEVAIRGFNSAFSGATYVLTDYRQANAAVIGVNVHSIMPSLPIDIERVEIVRGPGSALYGSGVDAGVIHYFTKDAFGHPGFTFAAAGGERSLLNLQGRLAGTVGPSLGLKVTGFVGRANDFSLEECRSDLLVEQRFDECPDPHDAQQLYIDGPRDTRLRKHGVSGSIEYRLGRRTSLVLDGGYGAVTTTALGDIGTIQGENFAAYYGHVRVRSGAYFAQAYLNATDSNDSYVYNGEPLVGLPRQLSAQTQYAFTFGGGIKELILGADIESLRPNSGGSIYGRNENNNLVETGAYLQSSMRLGSRLDVTAALRGDYHGQFRRIQFSPRAGLVTKTSANDSFRLTYNRSFVNPSVISLFLDLIAARLPFGGNTYLNVRAQGGVDGYTWRRNPAYVSMGAPTDLIASSLLPGMEGADTPIGVSTNLVYELMYGHLAAIPDEELARLLVDLTGLDPSLVPLLTSQMGTVKALLHPAETVVEGFSAGQLGMLNISTQQIDPVPNDLEPLPGLKEQVSQTFEAGYKGILGSNVLVAIDAYYTRKKNFVGALQMRTPFVMVPALINDLEEHLALGIAGNADLLTVLDLVETYTGLELTPESAAALLMDVAGSLLPDPSLPVAIVQPAENHTGTSILPELMITYPNFGSISYFGADLSVQMQASSSVWLFGNLSWVSDDYFDHSELKEEDPTAVLALNAPSVKFKIGGTYRMDSGFSVTASGRYVDGFNVISGQYIGYVEPYFQVDAGIGYAMSRTLRFDLNVSNVTNAYHREFIGAPKIGRLATVRLLYSMAR